MKKRTLGGSLEVSEISLGCMGLSHGNGPATEENTAIRLLQEAADMGYTMFDTAETYGFPADPHHNEKLVGKALKSIRNRVVIATKFGVAFEYNGGELHSGLKLDSRPETIKRSIENSLHRLFIRIYEDNVAGKLSDERFALMSKTYEDEQAQLKVEIQTLQQEIEVQERQIENLEQFIQRVHKYEDLQEMTPYALRELVKGIYIEAPDKSGGKRRQGIRISYDLVGFISVEELMKQETA